MFEHSEKHFGPSLGRALEKSGIMLESLKGDMFKVWDSHERKHVGFLERLVDRHPVVYTIEESKVMDRWAKKLVHRNPAIDRLWLSGIIFHRLWSAVLEQSPPHRYGRLVFQHENLFEDSSDASISSTDEEDTSAIMAESEVVGDEYVPEHKATRFAVVDRLSVLATVLPKMRATYGPLHAISQLRFPGARSGGHDFYYDGKVTNRTDSFTEHRLRVQYVLQVYRAATETTENAAWSGVQRMKAGSEAGSSWIMGTPIQLKFKNKLQPAVFDRFVEAVFEKKNRAFNLWGNPIRLGPTKVHVYALDRHVAQQLFIEITESDMLVVIPFGTCGNTIHRLVTNVQQFLDPAVEVWVGEQQYESLISLNVPAVKDNDHLH